MLLTSHEMLQTPVTWHLEPFCHLGYHSRQSPGCWSRAGQISAGIELVQSSLLAWHAECLSDVGTTGTRLSVSPCITGRTLKGCSRCVVTCVPGSATKHQSVFLKFNNMLMTIHRLWNRELTEKTILHSAPCSTGQWQWHTMCFIIPYVDLMLF